MGRALRDEYAKRPDETNLEWTMRRARMKADARDRSEPIVTSETLKHGYVAEDVMHIETGTRAPTYRRRSISSLVRMHKTGRIDNAQYEAAIRIARVAEKMERDVGIRGSSVARVDCSSTARDALVEHLSQVRDEATYSRWRRLIPLPRRMILDMVLVDRPLATTARIHGVRWEKARRQFLDALDLWCDLRKRVSREIDEHDLMIAHARIARAA